MPMPATHPTDRTLAALADDRLDNTAAAATRTHVDECRRCQLRLGASLPSIAGAAEPTIGSAGSVDVIEEVRDMDPARGQIWRLAWDGEAALAVIWRVEDRRVEVLPLVDVIDADQWCAVLTPGDSLLGTEVAVSVALAVAVPWAVLDAMVGTVGAVDAVETLRAAFKRGTPHDVVTGTPVVSSLDERLDTLGSVGDQFARFADAEWAGTGAPSAALTYEALTEAGLTIPRALAVSARGSSPTDDEADLIEAATGARPAVVVPDNVRRLLDHPKNKARIRQRAAAAGTSEAAERLRVARRVEPARRAARGTKGRPVDVESVINEILDE